MEESGPNERVTALIISNTEAKLVNHPDLTEEQWAEALERLTLHARRRYDRLVWRGVPAARGGTAPGGVEPADLAAETIIDVIEGRRVWNAEIEPDFQRFLAGVVDSKLSHLSRSLENRSVRGGDWGAGSGAHPDLIPSDAHPPDTHLSAEEERDKLQAIVLSLVKGDVLLEQVVDCLTEGITKPAEMATRIGVEVREIYNAQKRLRHRAESALRPENGA